MTGPLFIDAWLDRAPGATRSALTWTGGRLDQSAFRAAAAGWAGFLLRQGYGRGDRVALCLDKGPTAVTVLFGAMAAGVTVVPLDPTAPEGRIQTMLAETEPVLLLSARRISGFAAQRTVLADPTRIDSLPADPDGWARRPIAPDDLALILMTSGSTGRPKGVCITHGNVSAFVEWAVRAFGLTANDSFLSIAPLHFDLSLLDICASQMLGAPVHLLTDTETHLPGEIAAALCQQRVSVLYTVPTLLRLLVVLNAFIKMPPGALRWVLFAGEVMPGALFRDLRRQLPLCAFANLYGPTETNVVCWYQAGHEDDVDSLPIGQPCDHSKISLRDDTGQIVPTGCEGEICVLGPTVTPGYWNQPKATAKARLPGNLWRTGDFGRVGDDGALIFTGRRDDLVKIRGHRVALGEIEAAAMQSGIVHQAAAVIDPDTSSRIILHVVPDPDRFTPDELRSHMAQSLAPYAMSDRIVTHTRLPCTSTGKTDRTALRATPETSGDSL